MSNQNQQPYLQIEGDGVYPLYRSADGEFEMEHTEGLGWTLYVVLPRTGRFKLGQSIFRTTLAEDFNVKLEPLE